MINSGKKIIIFLLLLFLTVVGILFVNELSGQPTNLWGTFNIRDLLGYLFFGIPLFILLLVLYRYIMQGKALLFYTTSMAASMVITLFLWALKFRGVNVITHLTDFFWIFFMILLMLIVPVHLVRLSIHLMNRKQ